MTLNYFTLYADNRNKETEKAMIYSGVRPRLSFLLILGAKEQAGNAVDPEYVSKGRQ